jgi:hypothetical protein
VRSWRTVTTPGQPAFAVGDADADWTQDTGEIAQVAWIDPRELTAATTHALQWPALQKAGLV